MLRREQIFARRGVEELVRRIARHHQPTARAAALGEGAKRRKDEKLIANHSTYTRRDWVADIDGANSEVERVAEPRPDAIVVVEFGRIHRLRQAEHLEERRIRADDRMLELTTARDDANARGAAHELLARDAVDGADLAIERRGGWAEVRLPDEVCDLCVRRHEAVVGRTARGRPHGVATVEPNVVRDDEPLVGFHKRADERDPELRPIQVVVDAFAQQIVRLRAAAGIALNAEARSVGILGLCAELQAVHEHARRSERVRQRIAQRRELPAVQNVDIRIRSAEQRRIDGEEETSRLDLPVLDLAIRGLLAARADRVVPVLNDVARLSREDRTNLQVAELIDRLESVVSARKRRGDEPRGRRRKGDVADVDALEMRAGLALV